MSDPITYDLPDGHRIATSEEAGWFYRAWSPEGDLASVWITDVHPDAILNQNQRRKP